MVSLWPWKGEDSSPASFERALSALSMKIQKTQSHLDALRQHSRRYKALWTLYTSLAYMLSAIILGFVVGFKNCNPYEYTALAASPVIIYLGRTAVTSYYDYRISGVTVRLDEAQTERTKTISKLKEATKYNSTQELLEKYGERPTLKQRASSNSKLSKKKDAQLATGRTGLPPPPTANIPRRNPPPPQHQQMTSRQQSRPDTSQQPIYQVANPQDPPLQPEFAPNAFSPRQYSNPQQAVEGKWYDRVFDILLGDDETGAKNRIVLICKNCRLVNGQAPPGVKRLQDIGKWRCVACHAVNGEEDEASKIVAEIKEKLDDAIAEDPMTSEPEMVEKSAESSGSSSEAESVPVVRKTRAGRAKK